MNWHMLLEQHWSNRADWGELEDELLVRNIQYGQTQNYVISRKIKLTFFKPYLDWGMSCTQPTRRDWQPSSPTRGNVSFQFWRIWFIPVLGIFIQQNQDCQILGISIYMCSRISFWLEFCHHALYDVINEPYTAEDRDVGFLDECQWLVWTSFTWRDLTAQQGNHIVIVKSTWFLSPRTFDSSYDLFLTPTLSTVSTCTLPPNLTLHRLFGEQSCSYPGCFPC